jgi:hypothetical protein
MGAIRKLLSKVELNDVIGLAGLGLLTYGLHLVYAPLLFIVPGLIMVVFAVLDAMWGGRR